MERRLAAALERPVGIGSLTMTWGNPLNLELRDVRVANAAWGSEPDIIRLDGLSAQIDVWALLRGQMRYDKLRLDKPRIVLERNGEGIGNWRFTESGGPSLMPWAIVPKDRSQFPTLLDFVLNEGLVSYRASSGTWLRIALHSLAIRSAADNTPVTLTAAVDYNATPAQLTATTDSFSSLRKATVPFTTALLISTASSAVNFTGTMMEPLDVEGADGRLNIDAKNLGEFLKIFGADIGVDFPLVIEGSFKRAGDHWRLADITGALTADSFTGSLELDEGARRHADHIGLALDFARLDVKQLAGPSNLGDTTMARSLEVERNPGATIAARITAKQLQYGTAMLSNFVIDGALLPEKISIEELSVIAAGGTLKASGEARAVERGSHIAARAELADIETGQVAAWLGAEDDQLEGKLQGQLSFDLAGLTLKDALSRSMGEAVFAVTDGRVAQSLLESASTDLRALFRKREGWEQVSCFLGGGNLNDGIATLAPLRLRTPHTTLVAAGQVDLLSNHVDMTLRSDGSADSIFALNIPINIRGDFADVSIAPGIPSKAKSSDREAERLTPASQKLAMANACLH